MTRAFSRRRLDRLVIPFSRTASAEYFTVAVDFAVEIDSFAAQIANNSLAFVSGEFFWRQFDLHPLRGEKVIV